MRASEAFYKKAKQVIAEAAGDASKAGAGIRDLLETFLPDMSAELRTDLFQIYWERFVAAETPDLYRLAEGPGGVIDLFHGDLSAVEREFDDEEWDLIREAINEGAETMDLKLLQTLAGFLVEKGRY